MERTDIYLDLVIANPMLLAPIIGLLLAFTLVPKEKKLFLTLLFLVPWLSVARSPGLGPIAAAAKLSSGAAFLLIAYSAITHPGPKRDLPGILWLYPIMACIWFFLVLGVEERNVALVLRAQWVIVTIASLSLLRTIVAFEDLMRIVNALTFGCLIALALPISALILNPEEAFLRGLGRFQPYGANSNQIGMLFALSAPLLGYAMMTWKRVALRPTLIFLLALIVGMALITASRMTMLAIAMGMLPILLVLTKRPAMTIIGMGIAAVGLSVVLSIAEDTSLDRLGSLESQRMELWGVYITDVFSQRPLSGLLGTTGESFFRANEVAQHPHSAWFNLMYHGGLLLFIPMMILICYSTFSGYQVWKNRRQFGGNMLLYSVMFMLMVAMYVQGCFNQVVYWPTYTWSFLHVVLAGLFIVMWKDIRNGYIKWALPSSAELQEEHDLELENFEDFTEDKTVVM
ncbi:MAG: hypothetical protein VX436_02325 [Planctomycetota bacterium]|nr:hypothetical protein [Planctomycetota bacterium]